MTSLPKIAPDDPADFSWRVHETISNWTDRADTKASILLGLEGVLLGFIVTLSGDGKLFDDLSGCPYWLFMIGATGISLGVGAAVAAVFPQVRRLRTRKEWRDNYVFFGHLQHWQEEKLTEKLSSHTRVDELPLLAAQMIRMSKIASRKYLCLQISIISTVAGCLLLVITALVR